MAQQGKTGCGCLSGGCLAFVIVILLLLGAIGAGGFLLYQKAREFTSAEAASIPVYDATPERMKEVNGRIEGFKKAVESNGEAEMELSGDDINALIAGEPKWKDMKGKIYIRLADGLLYVDASVPLTEVTGFSDRFLNGTVGFDAAVENGMPRLVPKSIDLNGKKLPKEFEQSAADGFSKGFVEELEKNPDAMAFFARVKSFKIDGNKMRIHIVPASTESKPSSPGIVPAEDTPPPPAPSAAAPSPAAEQKPGTFLCKVQVMAYDRSSPPQALGYFQAGTVLDIVGPAAGSPGMIEVKYIDPQKGLIQALCKAEDVGMAAPAAPAPPADPLKSPSPGLGTDPGLGQPGAEPQGGLNSNGSSGLK